VSVREVTRAVGAEKEAARWVRTPGVDLLGEYQGGGFTEPHYLARRGDGQYAKVTVLLYRILEETATPTTAAELVLRLDRDMIDQAEPVGVDDVETMLRDQLAPVGMVTEADATEAPIPAPRSDPLLSLGLRGTLVSARTVQAVARPLAFFFYRPVIVVTLLALLVGDVWMVRQASLTGGLDTLISGPLLVVPLAVASILLTVLHEFGHAAGCRFGGGRPGRIGFGVMIIWPVFFTDVTDTYRLSRVARIRADLGGLYFDALGILLMIGAYAVTGYDVLALWIVTLHFIALEELLPIVRGDGYYLLGDISGVPDPFTVIGPVLRGSLPGRPLDPRAADLRPGVRRVMRAWALFVVPFIVASVGFMLWMLPVSVPRWIASVQMHWSGLIDAVDTGSFLLGTYSGASLLVLMVPVAGGTLLAVRLARQLHRAIRNRTSRQPRRVPRHRRQL
jgi:putative peptide zinc metalloprotease protein